jgi:hypothetical protein
MIESNFDHRDNLETQFPLYALLQEELEDLGSNVGLYKPMNASKISTGFTLWVDFRYLSGYL